MRIAVLGAGIAGVTTAYFLARDGHEVTVVEGGLEVAGETSRANGGVAGVTQVEPWAQPDLPWKLLTWIGRKDAPILIRFGEVVRHYWWGLRFLRRCMKEAYLEGLAVNTRLTLHSLEMFARVREELGMTGEEYDLNRGGALKLYFSKQSFGDALELAQRLEGMGCGARPVAPETAAELEPALAPRVHEIASALFFPQEEIGDCRKFALRLEEACKRLGVRFAFDTNVHRLLVRDGMVAAAETSEGAIGADLFVIALASRTAALLRPLGIPVPIVPVKDVTVTVPAAPWGDAIRSGIMDHARLYGLMRIGDRLRISGSAEFAGFDVVPAEARCQALIRNVLALFPGFAACLKAAKPQMWAGMRPTTPDGSPILGRTPIGNLFINAGHGPRGWSTSCGSARVVADLVSGRVPAISMDGLGLDRFGSAGGSVIAGGVNHAGR